MIFNSFNFIVIYPLLFLLYYVIPERYLKVRNLYLLIVSYALYISWKPIYSLILLGVTIVTFYSAKLIARNTSPRKYMLLGVVLSLLPLLFFKYFNFINQTLTSVLSNIGFQCQLTGLNWAIPIGISFFTFQALGYLWDVYYKRIPVENDFLSYCLFLSFFPSILSGPINKASLLLPQIKGLRKHFDYSKAVEGLKMLLWGMFMKVVVADRVALRVDSILDSYMNYSGASCFMASVFYTIQIYADFAGYSLMAIGVGKTLGFELTENFHRPYFAWSVTDFWRRWHISLSTWLKDYVYIPLGGSRCSKARNYWNIFITFLVSGIWHGANWTFIVWGILHGLFQIIEKMLGEQKCRYGWFGKSIKIMITFMLVNFAWIFFRMPTLSDAWGVIERMFDLSLPMTFALTEDIVSLPIIFFGIILLFLKDLRDEFFPKKFLLMNNRFVIVRWATYMFVIVSIMLFGLFGADQFIYANF